MISPIHVLKALYCHYLSIIVGVDFSNASFVVTVPPNEDSTELSDFVIPQQFNIIDDELDEIVQSFVLVGEIGADVPERFTCFQKGEGEIGCNVNREPTARFGATRIHINDNDGKFDMLYIVLDHYCDAHCSYDYWICSKETDCI